MKSAMSQAFMDAFIEQKNDGYCCDWLTFCGCGWLVYDGGLFVNRNEELL